MKASDPGELAVALQEMKEAVLIAVARRLISQRIPEQMIVHLARTLPAPHVMRHLKRSFPLSYMWNKLKRMRTATLLKRFTD